MDEFEDRGLFSDEDREIRPGAEASRVDRISQRDKRRFRTVLLTVCLVSALFGSMVGGAMVMYTTPRWAAPAASSSSTAYRQVAASPEYTGEPAVFASARLGPSVVGISAQVVVRTPFGRSMTQEASGSGIIVSADGYIVTNNHVVEGASSITVILSDGNEMAARLVGRDAPADLAVLKVEAENLPAAVMGDSDQLRVGETVVAIGSPMGDEFRGSVTQGIISGLNRSVQIQSRTLELIQTDAVINPGNSGGPLANANGEVIGINTLKIDHPQVEGMGFAVPINVVRPIVSNIMKRDGGRSPL